MMTHVASAYVRKGKLHIRSRRAFDAIVSKWRDGEYTITVERSHATRSIQQNRLYWGVYVKALADHTGYTPFEVHEILKAKFMPKHLALQNVNGDLVGEFVVGGTTRTLNKVEFGDYLREIHRWAGETLGVVIPEPVDEVA